MRKFKIKATFNSKHTELIIYASSSSNAMAISRMMFPNGRMLSVVAI
ncbi:hypothetical protein [Lutibacter sp.]|nr:hypothetical protein [Lutibacter sp.]MCF6168009.1 hypothetical protein [Lutibacter sp.]